MGVVNTTYTFTSTDIITSAKMNNIIDDTTFTSDAIQGTTLQVVSPGKLAVSAGGITSNELASQSVTPAKLSNSDFGDFTVSGGVATIDNGVVTPVKLSQPLTSAIAQNSTSGTSIDFTGIPSWVKRITVMFNGVSTNGSSLPIVQLGDSGGVETSGYNGYYFASTSFRGATSSGVIFNAVGGATAVTYGQLMFCLLDSSNSWTFSTVTTDSVSALSSTQCCGTKQLSETLDRIRLTTVNGTDTFDAGSVNIMYE
jgi:hypothetical protein